MIRRSLELIAGREPGGRIVLRSPRVGFFSADAHPGEGLVPGSVAGTLAVLGRRIDLIVPEGVEGTVAPSRKNDRSVAVAWGQAVLELEPGASRIASGGTAPPAPAIGSAGSADLGEGEYALRAPTTGVFYLRPDPSSPPFAAIGSTLESGQTAGLIEVMKCFSPIVHPGGAIPSPAIVERIGANEGQEVHPGQILFVLRGVVQSRERHG